MGNGFVSNSDVVEAAVSWGVIIDAQRAVYKSELEKLDVTLDGRQDGGFFLGQVKRSNKLAGEIVGSLFRNQLAADQKPKGPNASTPETPLEFGLKVLLSVVLFPLQLTGCDSRDYHDCVNPPDNCPIGPITCYYDENGNEQCVCDDNYEEECGRNGCSCEYRPHNDKW